MTTRPALLAALVEERFPAAAIEAERCDLRRPSDVRIAAPAVPLPADTLPAVRRRQRELLAGDEGPAVATIHTVAVARRAVLAEQANRRAAAVAHLRRPAADVEGRAS